MSKPEARKLMENSNSVDKKGVLWKKIYLLYKKMNNTTYYQRNKERLREQGRNKYRNLSEEDENKKIEYGKNRYHNMSEEKKQELKEYQKRRYQEGKESRHNNE